jgi:molecular chaperone GrpE
MSDSRQATSEPRQQRSDSPGARAPGDDRGQTGNAPRGDAGDAGAPTAGTGSGDSAPGRHGEPPVRAGEPARADSAEIEGDLDELVRVGAQRDEYLALAQRTQADFENYRKRVARESALAQERGVAKLVKELLPALDNLDRALAAAAEDDPLLEGVRLVRSEVSAALARVGVESFAPLGQKFDPALHEAMATTNQPGNGCEHGTIVEVYQPGYRLGEHIIRPARVVVVA